MQTVSALMQQIEHNVMKSKHREALILALRLYGERKELTDAQRQKTHALVEGLKEVLGVLDLRYCHQTGTHVTLVRTESDDADEGPYATICEEHGGIVTHRTKRHATSWLSVPDRWCPDCQEQGKVP